MYPASIKGWLRPKLHYSIKVKKKPNQTRCQAVNLSVVELRLLYSNSIHDRNTTHQLVTDLPVTQCVCSIWFIPVFRDSHSPTPRSECMRQCRLRRQWKVNV